jgi:hypothetical protein
MNDLTFGGNQDVSIIKFKDSAAKTTCYIAVQTITGRIAKVGGAIAPSITCLKD